MVHFPFSTYEVTVTLPFGGISLGNDSFPRGFFFHTNDGYLERIFLKSLAERRMPVYAARPTARDTLMHERMRIHTLPLSPRAHERLHSLFSALLADTGTWEQDTYGAQLTRMNSILWETLFGTERGGFVYLEIERVVRRLLTEKHLVKETLIHHLLFQKEWRTAFIELFSGVFGSHTESSGTHFFWYIDHIQKTRRRLFIENDTLVTMERDVTVPLTPEHIAHALETYTLIPSTALILIIVQGVEQLACGGGPSQLSYLPHTMQQWHALLARFDETTTFPNTSIYCGDNTLFHIKNLKNETNSLATLIDCILYMDNPNETINTALETTPLHDMIDALIPTLYYMYTKKSVTREQKYTIPHICIS
jgi:hypothetical protein